MVEGAGRTEGRGVSRRHQPVTSLFRVIGTVRISRGRMLGCSVQPEGIAIGLRYEGQQLQLLALEAQWIVALFAFIVFEIQQLAAMGTLEKLHVVGREGQARVALVYGCLRKAAGCKPR